MPLTSKDSFTYFIADLHLSADRDDINQCLFSFLQNQATQAGALYVLGDLFEVWIGDDDLNAFTLSIANAFKQLSETGIPVYFIHGNRDFLIRKKFANLAGLTLLPEQKIVNLYGIPTLIMHGDELCTKDIEYQKFRKKARSWWWPRIMLCLPLSIRRSLAQKGRDKSKLKQSKLTNDIMDVSQDEVISSMAKNSVNRLVHGHTHRPAIHEFDVNHLPAKRIVLGDWYEQGSILKVSREKVELLTMKFEQ